MRPGWKDNSTSDELAIYKQTEGPYGVFGHIDDPGGAWYEVTERGPLSVEERRYSSADEAMDAADHLWSIRGDNLKAWRVGRSCTWRGNAATVVELPRRVGQPKPANPKDPRPGSPRSDDRVLMGTIGIKGRTQLVYLSEVTFKAD